jgi:hypothetical protein
MTAAILSLAAAACLPSPRAEAAVAGVCDGVSLPPSVVTGIMLPVLAQLPPILNVFPLNLGNTSTGINGDAPIDLQLLDTNGKVVRQGACGYLRSYDIPMLTGAETKFFTLTPARCAANGECIQIAPLDDNLRTLIASQKRVTFSFVRARKSSISASRIAGGHLIPNGAARAAS